MTSTATLSRPMLVADLDAASMSVEVLEAELCRRAANMTAAEAEWMALLAEFDRRQAWASWGCFSCAAWLSWQIGLDLGAAREKVRVARALERLPRLAAAMASGQLSYSKVRALTRIAGEHNEVDLLRLAMAGTSRQVQRIVTAYRRCEPAAADTEERAYLDRGVWMRTNEAECELTVRLPAEAAKSLIGAIDRFLDTDREAGTQAARRADALVALAEHAVATADDHGRPDTRYLATVVLTPDVLDPEHESGGCCTIAAGDGATGDVEAAVPAKTAARVLCDAVVEGLVCDEAGDPLRLGRRRRVVSPKLRRALWFRDRGCRFPGCSNRGWLDAHHLLHWLDLGETAKENLVLFCRAHHRFVHEQGWTIDGDPEGEITLRSPTGKTVASRPPAVAGDASAVDAYGRTSADGQCQWVGDELHLDDVITILFSNEEVRSRRAASG